MTLRQLWDLVMTSRPFLYALLVVNGLGTIYGYIWYGSQLAITPPIFYVFVPDSPTASLFFTIAIIGWLRGTHYKWMEALGFITLIKYGVWAVAMNGLTLLEVGSIGWMGWMLVVSHGLMAVQALLYWKQYAFGLVPIVGAAVWTLHNDVIDYLFDQMPIYHRIMQYQNEIGYFTFWLSIASIGLAFWNWKWRERKQLREV